MKKKEIGKWLLIVSTVLTIASLLFMDPIIQDEGYHHFSDENIIFGIPNFWNVLSNLPFFLVGVIGLINWTNSAFKKTSLLLFYLGILFVSIGSGYYHLFPNSVTLIWDRLPMTITFMTLFSIIIGEFVSEKIGGKILVPLIIIGLLSIGYWVFGAQHDLRFYAWVQFYPMLAIPIILACFNSEYSYSSVYWMLLIAYLVAKVFEHYDFQVHELLGFISGHSLKHVIAAFGLYLLVNSYSRIYHTDK